MVSVTDTGVGLSNTRASVSNTGMSVSDTGVRVSNTRVSVLDTGVGVSNTRASVSNTPSRRDTRPPGSRRAAPASERLLYCQPTALDPRSHRDDFNGPASRHGSLNSLLQVA